MVSNMISPLLTHFSTFVRYNLGASILVGLGVCWLALRARRAEPAIRFSAPLLSNAVFPVRSQNVSQAVLPEWQEIEDAIKESLHLATPKLQEEEDYKKAVLLSQKEAVIQKVRKMREEEDYKEAILLSQEEAVMQQALEFSLIEHNQLTMLQKIESGEEHSFILCETPMVEVQQTLDKLEQFVNMGEAMGVSLASLHLENIQCSFAHMEAFVRLANIMRDCGYKVIEQRTSGTLIKDEMFVTLIAQKNTLPFNLLPEQVAAFIEPARPEIVEQAAVIPVNEIKALSVEEMRAKRIAALTNQ